ncbi:MAG: hypothetical protein IT380_11040 [Myxococcales bacterium]|nr:hypothetical protein [Myxococcales bacterium]
MPDSAVELSLNALVEHLDDHLFEQATRDWRVFSGVTPDAPPVPELPELTRPDAFQYVSELIDSPRTDEGKRARLVLLRREVARRFLRFRAGEPRRVVDELLRKDTFLSAAKRWTPAEALLELPRLASRELRDALERELSAHLWEQRDLFTRRDDALVAAAAELRFEPPALVELLHGRPLTPRQVQATALLRDTEDAFRDLLGYALRRLDTQLAPGQARVHDVRRASGAPWLCELFRREDLFHAVTRCLGDLGLHPSAEGRITVDQEAKEGRAAGAHLFELRVPEQLRLLLQPDLGYPVYASWLSGWGMALSRAHVGRSLPFVERRLGDHAVVQAQGRLFASFLLEEAWLKRYLRLTSPQAREAARLFAFFQLVELRRDAALTLVHKEHLARGAFPVDDAVPRLADALGADVSRGRTLVEGDLLGDAVLSLDGWALEGRLAESLRERFNEDFFRNPAAGRWLVEAWGKGQRDDAAQVAAALGDEALDVLRAGRRRVTVMGA